MLKFYGHFAVCFGTITLIIIFFTIVLETQIDSGLIGLYGVPMICSLYAILRTKKIIVSKSELEHINEVRELEIEIEKLKIINDSHPIK